MFNINEGDRVFTYGVFLFSSFSIKACIILQGFSAVKAFQFVHKV